MKMNIKVVVCVFLLVSKTIAFDYEEFDLQYDSSSTIPLSSTKPTTSTSSSTTTSTTIPDSTSSSPKSKSTSTPTVAIEGDGSEKRTSNRVDSAIETGGPRATESRKYNKEVYRHRNERPPNPKCVTEDDLMKKIHEVFLAPTQPPDDYSQQTTTTIRVERDHPNPYGRVRNFKNLIFFSFLLYLIFIRKKQNMCS